MLFRSVEAPGGRPAPDVEVPVPPEPEEAAEESEGSADDGALAEEAEETAD